jgi:hypothetical protein
MRLVVDYLNETKLTSYFKRNLAKIDMNMDYNLH